MIGTINSPPFMFFIEVSFYLVKVELFSNVNYFMNKKITSDERLNPAEAG